MPIRRCPRRLPDHDPRSWPELRDPPTEPIPLAVRADDWLSIYEATADALLAVVPRARRPRHALGIPRPDLMGAAMPGRHADDDNSGVADYAEQDGTHDADAWIGATREMTLADHDEAGTTTDG